MNIGTEGEAFVAEPLPEPQIVEVAADEREREHELVPVGREREHVPVEVVWEAAERSLITG